MSTRLNRLHGTRAVTWRTVLGLVLVPLTVAGVLLWGLWSPTERLDTVTAAVVNLDDPVTLDGQVVPMGRVLAAELIGGDTETNFTWMLTDEEDAQAGLDDGRYATVVTIPENFSSAATSASRGADEAETARIGIETSERGRLLDTALSNTVTSTATAVLNEQLGTQFVGTIFVGMTELAAGVGDAADGARQLATGGSQLADGAAELADGTAELSAGASQLGAGASQLSGGIAQLSGGTSELSDGASKLGSGASVLANALSGFASGTTELAVGARDSATGAAALSAGLDEYVGAVNGAIDPVLGGGSELLQWLAELAAEIESGAIPMPDEQTKQQTLEAIASAQAELSGIGEQLTALRGAGTMLADGLRVSAAGSAEIATGLEGLAGGASELAGGAAELSGGATALSGGASQLAAGAAAAASGASQLSSGVGELAANTPALAEGASQLADGARAAAEGSQELANGLGAAAAGIPSYTEEQGEKMASTMVRPVNATGASDELFNAAGVPLFAGIALWAGALASFLVISPLWRRTRDAARGVGAVTLRSALPAVGIGATQGAIAGVILPILLGYDLAQGLGFFALAMTAGISFALVNQGLSALLGGFGRFLSFALLVVAFAIGVISTAPPLLQAIGDASPVGALFSGFQAVAMGAGGVPAAIWALAVWGVGGLALTAFAVARARRG